MLLEQELGQPVNVINATGGKGVSGHNRGITARPDGYTLTMITFELNTMHWMGLTDLTYNDCTPLVSVNEDYAALLVRSDSPWTNLRDLEDAVRLKPQELTASGTAIGGAWHLALAGWLNAIGTAADDVTWVPSEGANPSLQQLISGGVDMVCCSLPEARTLLEADQVRALGVMSPQRAPGFDQIPTFREAGTEWTLGGWRGLAVPSGTPQPIADRLATVILDIVSADAQPGTFAEFMTSQKFDNTCRGPKEFRQFLKENDEKLGKLLTSEAMQSVSQDRFHSMAFPYAIMGLIGVAGIALTVSSRSTLLTKEVDNSTEKVEHTVRRLDNFVAILVAAVIYILLAETVGFLVLSTLILLWMLLKFGNKPRMSIWIALTVAPSIYFLFAYLLRVPLPRGWLG
jgi:tripartite-type tricarboxylate transporter receptor subunit TctC